MENSKNLTAFFVLALSLTVSVSCKKSIQKADPAAPVISSIKPDATVDVNLSAQVMPNAPLLLGITYDCRSSLKDQAGMLVGYHNANGTFNPAVDAVFKDFPMVALRYPANGIMQGFEWKQSIGPIGSRTAQKIFAQPSYPSQVLEFGFDEFMTMTSLKGVDPKEVQLMIPIYDEESAGLTPTQISGAIPDVVQSNADWVEYANAPNDGSNPGGGTDWAAKRAANGHPQPYGIKLWNLGNEPFTSNEFDLNGAGKYITTIVPIIDAMLAVDPTIKLTVTVTANPNSSWTDAILKSPALQEKIYGVNSHFFLTEEVVPGVPAAAQPNVNNAITRLIALAAAAKAKGYKLIVGDNAHAIVSTSNPTQAEQDIAMQWQGANETADFLLATSQIDNIERANFWVYGLWINQWHPIRKNADGTFTSMPVAELYKIFNPVFLNNSVSVTTVSPASADGIPYSIRSSAFISKDLSKLNVVSVNRDKINDILLKVNAAGYTIVKARLLTATALNSDSIVESAALPDASGNYKIPHTGILIVEFKK